LSFASTVRVKVFICSRKSEANRPKTKILSYVLFNCLDYLNLDKNTKEMSYSYLISSNKYLPKQLIKKLWELKDKYKSIRNYYFVTQSNLPIEYLIELKDSQEIITNPNCPDSILLEKYDNINKFSKIYKAQLLLVLHKKGLLCLQPKSL
jgi:23S rRNA C2498 (ribose-2'-O)-methylase RlmM